MWNTTGLLIYSLQLMAKEYFPSEKTTTEWNGPALATHSKAKTKNVLDTVKRACAQIHTDTRAHTNRVCTGHTLSSIHKYDEYACLCAISKTMTVNIKTVLFSKDKYNKDCERTGEGERERERRETKRSKKPFEAYQKRNCKIYANRMDTRRKLRGGGVVANKNADKIMELRRLSPSLFMYASYCIHVQLVLLLAGPVLSYVYFDH